MISTEARSFQGSFYARRFVRFDTVFGRFVEYVSCCCRDFSRMAGRGGADGSREEGLPTFVKKVSLMLDIGGDLWHLACPAGWMRPFIV